MLEERAFLDEPLMTFEGSRWAKVLRACDNADSLTDLLQESRHCCLLQVWLREFEDSSKRLSKG